MSDLYSKRRTARGGEATLIFTRTRRPSLSNSLRSEQGTRFGRCSRSRVVKSKPNAFQWLSEDLQIEFPNKGEVLLIKLETTDAASSVKIVAAVVDAYMSESVLDERNERLQRLDSLERVFAETEGKVRARRGDIAKLADALGTGDSESLASPSSCQSNAMAKCNPSLARLALTK